MNDRNKEAQNQQLSLKKKLKSMYSPCMPPSHTHTHFVHNLPFSPVALLLLVCSHEQENITLLWHQVRLLWNSADTNQMLATLCKTHSDSERRECTGKNPDVHKRRQGSSFQRIESEIHSNTINYHNFDFILSSTVKPVNLKLKVMWME